MKLVTSWVCFEIEEIREVLILENVEQDLYFSFFMCVFHFPAVTTRIQFIASALF